MERLPLVSTFGIGYEYNDFGVEFLYILCLLIRVRFKIPVSEENGEKREMKKAFRLVKILKHS